jgi:hypothetical protein
MIHKALSLLLLLVLLSIGSSDAKASDSTFQLLEDKALEYETNLQANHLQENQLVTRIVGGGTDEEGDSATYTSYYVAAEAFRYRATKDKNAYQNVTNGLMALHRMQEASGQPGIVSRFVTSDGHPWERSRSFTSKDVYTSVLFAYSVAYPILRGKIKKIAKQDVLNIGNNFLVNNYAFVGAYNTFVDLKPGFDLSFVSHLIEKDPQSIVTAVDNLERFRNDWAPFVSSFVVDYSISFHQYTIDRWDTPEATGGKHARGAWCEANESTGWVRDFLRCLLRQVMTKDEMIAVRDFWVDIGGLLTPMVEAGQTPEDIQIKAFFDRLFAPPIPPGVFPAPCAFPNCQILLRASLIESVLTEHWRTGVTLYLNRMIRMMKNLPRTLTAFLTEQKKISTGYDFYYGLEHGLLKLDRTWVDLIRRIIENPTYLQTLLSSYTSALPEELSQPEELKVVPTNALLLLHVLKVAYQVTRAQQFKDHYDQVKNDMLKVARIWGDAGDVLLTELFGDAAADAARSSGTHQLQWVALYDLLTLEQSPATRKQYQEVLEGAFSYISDELNSFVNFIHAIHSDSGIGDEIALPQGLESLILFPPYGYQNFVYSCDSDLVKYKYGGCISFLGGELVARDPIFLDERPRDASTWQRSPRRLTNNNPNRIFPGVDFLLAYWMGRAHELLDSSLLSSRPNLMQYTDVNGDGKADALYFDTLRSKQVWVSLSTGSGFMPPQPWVQHGDSTPNMMQYADVNGDGLTDALYFDTARSKCVWVSLSTGSGFTPPQSWVCHGDSTPDMMQYADVNGDGRVDALFFDTTRSKQVWVSLSTGSGFTPPQPWVQHGDSTPNMMQYADVNGDGKADALYFDTARSRCVWVSLSTGTGFPAPQSWLCHGDSTPNMMQYADVNSDGKADALYFDTLRSKQVWASLSTGSGFTPPQPWVQHGDSTPDMMQYADVNGDGKADALYFDTARSRCVWVSLSTGTGFPAPQSWVCHGDSTPDMMQYADVNDDGKADALYFDTLRSKQVWVSLSTGSGFTIPQPWAQP